MKKRNNEKISSFVVCIIIAIGFGIIENCGALMGWTVAALCEAERIWFD